MNNIERYAHENFVPTQVMRNTLSEWTALLRGWPDLAYAPELLTLELATARLDERGEMMTLDEIRAMFFPLIDILRKSLSDARKEEIARVLIANFG